MIRGIFFLFVTLAVTVALPGASAWEFAVSGLEEAAPTALASGGTGTYDVTVSIAQSANQNIICASAATIKVVMTLSGVDEATGFNGSLAPTELDFDIAAGAHLGGTNPWPGGEDTSTLTVDLGTIPAGHTEHDYIVEGKYDGTVPEGCQGDFGQATDTSTLTLPLEAPAAEDGNATNGPDSDGEDAESPAPGALFVLGAIGIVALARRRRA